MKISSKRKIRSLSGGVARCLLTMTAVFGAGALAVPVFAEKATDKDLYSVTLSESENGLLKFSDSKNSKKSEVKVKSGSNVEVDVKAEKDYKASTVVATDKDGDTEKLEVKDGKVKVKVTKDIKLDAVFVSKSYAKGLNSKKLESKVNSEPVSKDLSKKLEKTDAKDPIVYDEAGNKTALAENIKTDKQLKEMGLEGVTVEQFNQIVEDMEKQHAKDLKDGTIKPTSEEKQQKARSSIPSKMSTNAINLDSNAGQTGTVVSELIGSFAGEKASMFVFKIGASTYAAACYQHELISTPIGSQMQSEGALSATWGKRLSAMLEYGLDKGGYENYGRAAIMSHVVVHKERGDSAPYGLSSSVWSSFQSDSVIQGFYNGSKTYPEAPNISLSKTSAELSDAPKGSVDSNGDFITQEATVNGSGATGLRLTSSGATILVNGSARGSSTNVSHGDKVKFLIPLSGNGTWSAKLSGNYKSAGSIYTYKFVGGGETVYQNIAVSFPSSDSTSVNYGGTVAKGKLDLLKMSAKNTDTDKNNAYDMSGAEYTIYRDSALTKKLGTMVTDASGKTNSVMLYGAGDYYVKETKPAKAGYLINENSLKVTVPYTGSATVKLDGKMAEEPMYDPLRFKIKKAVESLDEAHGDVASFQGIQFRVSHYKNLYNSVAEAQRSTPDASAVFETDAKGRLDIASSRPVSGTWPWQTSMGLNTAPLGTIVVEEIKTLPGLTLNTTPGGVQIYDSGDHVTPKVKFLDGWAGLSDPKEPVYENKIFRGGVSVTKADSGLHASVPQGDASLEGIKYNIINQSASDVVVEGKTYKKGQVVKSITTSYDSSKKQYVATTAKDLLPYGTYDIEEVSANTSYHNAKWKQTFTIREDGEMINFDSSANKWNENDVFRGGVTVVKADADLNESKPQGDGDLVDITYEIINKSKESVVVDGKTYKVGEVVKTIKSVYDEQTKQYVATATSDTLPYGTYEINEVQANESYHNDKWKQTFQIRKDGEMIAFDSGKNNWNTNKVKRGGVSVTKADADLNESKPQGDGSLEGITYEITNKSKEAVVVDGKKYEVGQVVKTIKSVYDSSTKQYVATTGNEVLPYGTYEIKETIANESYHNAEWKQTFEIREAGQMVAFDSSDNWNTNEVKRGGVSVTKADFDLKESSPQGDADLENITYDIINQSKETVVVDGKKYAKGEVVKTIKSKYNQSIKQYIAATDREVLPYGTYDIVETTGNDSYHNAKWKQTFKIREAGQVIEFNSSSANWNENKVFRGGVSVTKADSGLHLSSPQGDATLKDINYEIVNNSKNPVVVDGKKYAVGQVVKTITSKYDSSKKQFIATTAKDSLPYGTYTINEVSGNESYHNAKWTQTFAIRKDGEMINFDSAKNNWNENDVFRGGVTVVKADADLNESAPQGDGDLVDIVYEITNKSKEPVVVDGKTYKVGEVVKTIKSVYDEQTKQYVATATSDTLPYGTYEINEVQANESYHNDKWKQTFQIRKDGEMIAFDSGKNNWNTNKVKRGGVSVTKADADLEESKPQGDGSLEGITYEIINRSKTVVVVDGKKYQVGEVVKTIKSVYDKDANQYIATTGNGVLPYGTYEIVETVANESYHNAGWKQTFEIREAGQMVAFDSTDNNWNTNEVKRGGVLVTKADFDLKESTPQGDGSLEEITYDIINKSKEAVVVDGKTFKVGEVVKTIKSKYNENIKQYIATTGAESLPYGTYDIVETSGNESYHNAQWKESFKIRDAGQVIEFNSSETNWNENKVFRGGVSVTKADSGLHTSSPQGDANLENIKYEIVNNSKSVVVVDGKTYKVGEVVKTITSKYDEDKKQFIATTAKDSLPYGTYTINEVSGNDSYLNAKWSQTFAIRKDGEMINFDSVENKWNENDVFRGGVSVVKADADLNESAPQGDGDLVDITYEITNKSKEPVVVDGKTYKVGEVVKTIKSVYDEQTKQYIATATSDTLPYGTYEIKEVQANESYHNDEWKQTFQIRKDGEMIAFDSGENNWNTNKVKRGGVSVVKADADLEESKPQGDGSLEGITYDIINKSKTVVVVDGKKYKVGEVVKTIKSVYDKDANQYIATTGNGVLPYGTYEIVETVANESYNKAEWKQTFEIREAGQMVAFDSSENHWNTNEVKRGGVSVTKADADLKESTPQGDGSLENITYDIINQSKETVVVNGKKVKKGEVVTTITSKYNENIKQFVAETGNNVLPYGTYDIVETSGNESYHNAKWKQSFKIREAGQVVEFNSSEAKWNENKVKRGGVSVTKADFDSNTSVAQGDASLEDVTYDIINKSKSVVVVDGKTYKVGEVVTTIKSKYDESSKTHVAKTAKDLLPYGTYDIVETKAGEGYENAKWTQTFSIREDGQMFVFDSSENNWNVNKVVHGGLSIAKYDLETNQSLTLGDASFVGTTFNVVNLSKKPVFVNGKSYGVGDIIMGIGVEEVKGEDGKVEYKAVVGNDVLPYGTYGVYETAGSDGYLPTALNTGFVYEVHEAGKEGKIIANATVTVDKDGKPTFKRSDKKDDVSAVKNQVKREDLTFKKKAEDTQDRMTDIPFVVTSKTTGEKHIIVTDENGIFNSEVHPHSKNTNANDPTAPNTNGAVIEKDGKWVVADASKLDATAGVWFTGVDPELTKWAEDGKSYEVNGQKVSVNDKLRAFPYDKYTIQELRSANNEGYNLISVGVTLHQYGDVTGNGVNLDYGTLNDKPVGVATTLTGSGTNLIPNVDKDVTLVDTLDTWGLDLGKKYTVTGELHAFDKDDKDLGVVSESKEEIESKKPFGTYEVKFTLNPTKLPKGTVKVVAFERISNEDEVVAKHEDPKDEDQTVRIPEIGTKLTYDNEHVAPSVGSITLVDTVSYKNLEVGRVYTMTGTLQDKSTGKPYLDKNGKEVTASTTFTPTTKDGTVDVPFVFEDSSINAGKTVVAFESLTTNNVEFAVHADIEDEGQTVRFPEIGTTATDGESGDHVGTVSKEITINDAVKYKNLVPGKEYTITGTAHVKNADGTDGGELKDADGKVVTMSKKFTPEKSEGEVVLSVTFKPASDFAGSSVVMFEEVAKDDVIYAIHADITDEGQTVTYPKEPKIGTTLTDEKGSHEINPDGKVTLIDEIKYEGLTVGKEYEATGTLMVDEKTPLKDADGKPVTATAKFTPEKENGSVKVTFEFDAKLLDGVEKVVAFEEVSQDGKVVAEHKDIKDEGQTVKVTKPTEPKIGTTLTDEKGSHEINPEGKVKLIDEIKYENLTVGKEYEATGTLMVDEKTPLKDADGKPVTATAKFTPEKANGSVKVTFEFDAKLLDGVNKVVAFEEVSHDGKVVAEHKDINDEGQTVKVTKPTEPKIGTTLTDEAGNHEITPDGKVKLVDVIKYENLTVGKEYEATGTLMVDKDTPLTDADGKPVTGSAKFTPEKENGTVNVTFEFDAKLLDGIDKVVAFEEVSADGKLVADHKDINDEGQTVKVTKPTEPKIGTTLTDEKGSHEVTIVDGKIKLIDVIKYEGLTVGKEYEATGTLMVDEKTPLKDADGKPVTATAKFTPEKSSGTVDVVFEFDSKVLDGVDKVVAFEEVSADGKLVADHKDINDEGQTVKFTKNPTIGTILTDEKGNKTIDVTNENINGTFKLVDEIKYDGLTVGKEYEVSGTLMVDANTPLQSNGKPVTATAKFTPEKSSGSVKVTFEFEGKALDGVNKVVAFEEVSADGKLVAEHKDFNDANQTVTVTRSSSTTTKPSEDNTPKKEVGFLKTGRVGSNTKLIGVAFALVAVAGIGFVWFKRFRHNDEV